MPLKWAGSQVERNGSLPAPTTSSVVPATIALAALVIYGLSSHPTEDGSA